MDGPTLWIRARPSPVGRRILLVLHGGAIIAPWLSGLDGRLCLAASLFAALSLLRFLAWCRRHCGGWEFGFRAGRLFLKEDGVESAAELLPDSVLWPAFLVLRLRVGGRVRSLVLLFDSCSADELRRLRVAARLWQPVTASQGG